ncbi:MAG: D-cysteine desulfhydrase family protein [Candidatus Aminicenantales bacterium]
MEKELLKKISRWPRLSFLILPTPIYKLVHLTAALGGPEIYVKRDDLTGPGFGGNKTRKLEFIVADAIAKGCNAIVTWGSVQSNWCFQTVLTCRRFGLTPVLFLFTPGQQPPCPEGNLFLDRLAGAEIHFRQAPVGKVVGRELALREIEAVLPELEARGLKPYVVAVGGSMPMGSMDSPLGAISYVLAFHEAWDQARALGLSFSHIIHASGSGATQAGLLIGAKILAPTWRIIGISVSDDRQSFTQEVLTISRATAASLRLQVEVTAEQITVLDDYLESGYGALSRRVVETIGQLLQKEGLVLDPVYTAKAMTGLIDLTAKGYFRREDKVLFFHTGGAPGLFALRRGILKIWKKAQA